MPFLPPNQQRQSTGVSTFWTIHSPPAEQPAGLRVLLLFLIFTDFFQPNYLPKSAGPTLAKCSALVVLRL